MTSEPVVASDTRDAVLERRLKRLMVLRLLMVTTLLLIAVYVEAVSETLRPVNPLYYLIIATYGLTLVHVVALKVVRNLGAHVYLQVMGDLLTITGLVYLTGGVRAGFILLYPMSVLSGSVLLYRRGGLTLAAFATIFYAAMLYAVRTGMVPPEGLFDVPFMTRKALVYSVFVTGVACTTVGLIGSYMSETVRTVGAQLQAATGQVADLHKLNQLLVNSIHSGLLMVDATGRVLYVNDFGAAMLGTSTSTISGTRVHEVFNTRLLEAAALGARAAHERLARLEVTYNHPEGRPLQLGVSVSPLALPGQPGGGHLLVFQDLTEIKRLERELRTNEKLAAMGEMAAELAHEIRNPLGSISGSAQVLMGEAGISPEQERLLAIIKRESGRLSDTLNRFLFQARAGDEPRQAVDIGPMLEEAATLLANGEDLGADHRVEFARDAGPHVCLADGARIVQVFWNLARNGLEAMPAGGLLRVRLVRDGKDAVLSVADEGVGIAQEDQRRIFEPFRSGRAGGTGLGLAIVYAIVHEHGGDIRVNSLRGRGTEVVVRLPLVLAGPA
jgi:two-component system sensor histidine kinase PilS (NtrC family)